MARIRSIKPDFFRHRRLFLAERETGMPLRVAFAGLWCAADREGRFRWEPEELKLDCLPFDEIEFSRVLDALATREFIEKYEVNGRLYGWIPSFKTHQFINNREMASFLPEPSKNNNLTRSPRDDDASLHASGTSEARDTRGREGKGREGKLEEEGNDASGTRPARDGNGEDPPAEEPRRKAWGTAEDEALAKLIFKAVKVVAPTAKEPNWHGWANAIRLMREQDNRTHEQILDLFVFANRDSFWRVNILSPATLRDKWTQLEAKRGAHRVPDQREGPTDYGSTGRI